MRTPNNDLYTNNTIDVQLTKKQAYRLKRVLKDQIKQKDINDFPLYSLLDDLNDKL